MTKKKNKIKISKPPNQAVSALTLKKLIAKAQGESCPETAGNILFKAWQADPKNHHTALLVSLELSDLGLQSKAIELLQEFIQCNEISKEVLQIAGKISMEIGAYKVAVQLYQQVINFDPKDENSYELLVSALGKAEQFDVAIDLLQRILPVFDTNARLWLRLGEILDKKNGRNGESKAFYQQAYTLSPNDYDVLIAYADSLKAGDLSASLYESALAIKPDGTEANLGLAIIEFSRGNLRKAWHHYEYRLDTSRKADETAIYEVDTARWNGEPLQGKNILVMAEQGIGDEVFFAANFQRLINECEQLFIGCEPRLVSVFKRSFPKAIVGPFIDKIANGKRLRSFPEIDRYLLTNNIQLDYMSAFASSCAHYWGSLEELPVQPDGYLVPDQHMVSRFKNKCESSENGNLKVGISWQSGKLSKGRKHSYPGLESILPLLQLPGIDFFVLQYSYEKNVIEEFSKQHGVKLHIFDNIDLKTDIEANLALMHYLDVVIGPPIATQSFALALGKPVFMISDGLPWTVFGQTDGHLPLYQKAKVFSKIAGAWAPAYDKVRQELENLRPKKSEEYQPSDNVSKVPENWIDEFRSSYREKARAKPTPSHIEPLLHQYFSSLEGRKVGICWGVDFKIDNMDNAEYGKAFLKPLIDSLDAIEANVVCLHPNVSRENALSFMEKLPLNGHFFADFSLLDRYSVIENVFDHLDIVIGPASFITLAALLHNTKTLVLNDEGGWDLANPKVCAPIENQQSKWFDYRKMFRQKALADILLCL